MRTMMAATFIMCVMLSAGAAEDNGKVVDQDPRINPMTYIHDRPRLHAMLRASDKAEFEKVVAIGRLLMKDYAAEKSMKESYLRLKDMDRDERAKMLRYFPYLLDWTIEKK